jgi:phosphoadenosine phosphosulfate reductase
VTFTAMDVAEWQERVRGWSPVMLLEWAFGLWQDRVTLASSFGLEDMVLVDMACRVTRPVDVFCLDTGVLFPETYDVMARCEQQYPVVLRRIAPTLSLEAQERLYGPALWERNPDQCCAIRKVEPLTRALEGYQAWITGIRREQAPTRAQAEPLEWDAARGLVKLNPLAFWTQDDVAAYVRNQHVPYNPLHDQGYPSIGCVPCTRPVRPGEDPRAGRWAGFQKTECGLHVDQSLGSTRTRDKSGR